MNKGNSNSQDGRGSYAKTGPRDENGQLEPKNSQSKSSGSNSGSNSSKSSHDGRGFNAKNEARDSQGRFTSK